MTFNNLQKPLKAVSLAIIVLATSVLLAACTTTQTAYTCSVSLKSSLASSIRAVESKLSNGCEYSFDNYFAQLLDVAANNPDPDNKRQFSDFLVRVSDQGVISKRQAKSTYNRYFNVKFVSLTGDYNTCSQTCPVRSRVLAEMQSELLDKELGLVRASEDNTSYYRADLLLKEAQLVLEATCRACEAGNL
ncbi:MAG: hypothetical protein O6945_13695 [Gammaproteobacteria bacterium]|nr:hypothetical protein [Gammaproteobacteria bacterium]